MKARNILMSVLAAGCLSVACFAEAASVALLPLINTSDYENPEEVSATYHAAAVRSINNAEGFTLMDSDSLTAVLDKNLEEGKLPSKEAMQAIANQAGVDVIIGMHLKKLDYFTTFGGFEEKLHLQLDGDCVVYNALTGKFQKRRLWDDTVAPMDIYARSNFELESWSNNVRSEVNKAIGMKKFKADKVKFGW